MTADLLRLLDELDAAREKATPGEWGSPEYTSTVYGGDPAHLLRVASSVHPADAALIVAAVNALPKLTAALRAVLAECDRADASLRSAVPMSAAESLIESGSHTVKVGRLRRAIAAALTPKATL